MSFIEFKDVCKYYMMGEQQIKAANKVSFSIEKGDFCVILGPSGAGKTTVLNILGGMDLPSDGVITVDGNKINEYNDKQLTKYRRHDVGFVFQFYNLVQNLTAFENVELASEICLNPKDTKETLELVGLSDRMNNFPSQLSGGEQQRVSIARAIAKNPKILLCDEPTGALDYQTGKNILKLLHDCCKKTSQTVIVITHNSAITAMADRVIRLKNGSVLDITLNEHPLGIEEIEW